ncbi:MAG: hypothetical protein P8N43_04610 [Alphaproteobacteria bacterium]|nr:hypothetical protein [Alphaproteobacteria bacterium]
MAQRSRHIRDFKAPSVPTWPRVLLLFGVLGLIGMVGWIAYTHSDIGQCHGQQREVAEFRFGVNLKKMMNLPVLESDRERFEGMCRLYMANCHGHIGSDARKLCRPV